jgi:hypothetical protein
MIYAVRTTLSDVADEVAWNHWYDHTHIPQLLTVPGFRSVKRYSELRTPRSYLTVYEIDSPTVLDSAEYRAVAGWGPWAAEVAACRREIYEESVVLE